MPIFSTNKSFSDAIVVKTISVQSIVMVVDAKVLEEIQNGYCMPSLPCPISCPELLYEIMRECWRDDAASRPTFETLQWRLEDFFFTDTRPSHVDPATLR